MCGRYDADPVGRHGIAIPLGTSQFFLQVAVEPRKDSTAIGEVEPALGSRSHALELGIHLVLDDDGFKPVCVSDPDFGPSLLTPTKATLPSLNVVEPLSVVSTLSSMTLHWSWSNTAMPFSPPTLMKPSWPAIPAM